MLQQSFAAASRRSGKGSLPWRRFLATGAENAGDFGQSKVNAPLYEGHEQISLLQRTALAIGSAFFGLKEPTRSDMIATLGETTGHSALRHLHKQMISDPVGQRILRERPILNTSTIDMEYLRTLPSGTFGKEYTNFMDGCNISSDTREPVRFVDHEELAYVMLRYRQIHDFTHLLTGFPSVSYNPATLVSTLDSESVTSDWRNFPCWGLELRLLPRVPNEIAVKWFEMVHFRLPMCALAAIFAPIRLTSSERHTLQQEIIPWALYAGYRSKLLLNVYFEKHFERDINEFRREIGLIPAPIML